MVCPMFANVAVFGSGWRLRVVSLAFGFAFNDIWNRDDPLLGFVLVFFVLRASLCVPVFLPCSAPSTYSMFSMFFCLVCLLIACVAE